MFITHRFEITFDIKHIQIQIILFDPPIFGSKFLNLFELQKKNFTSIINSNYGY
jgi:hypothetical protein